MAKFLINTLTDVDYVERIIPDSESLARLLKDSEFNECYYYQDLISIYDTLCTTDKKIYFEVAEKLSKASPQLKDKSVRDEFWEKELTISKAAIENTKKDMAVYNENKIKEKRNKKMLEYLLYGIGYAVLLIWYFGKN